MTRRFKAYHPEQILLLPPSLKSWLPEDHLAFFVSDVVDQLDLSETMKAYEGDGRGQPAYHPAMMVKLLFYAYCVGVPSSRKIETKTHEDVAFRVIAADQHPDHDTIAEFRSRHLKALSGLFVQVLLLCRESGLVKLGHVALDGTKVKANASKRKAMSYARMGEREKELEREVKQLLEKSQTVDAEEDKLYGRGKRGDELPEELRFRKKRLQKIREAKEFLERKAREKARDEGRIDNEGNPAETGYVKGEKHPPGVPRPKDQRNFTDPESKIMRDSTTKEFMQGYNAQAAVDSKAQVIVAADVTDEPNDKKQVEPMVEQIEENAGERPKALSCDSGYYSEANVEFLETKLIEPLIPPDKKKHTEAEAPPPRGRPPKHLSKSERMRRKMNTKRCREKYKLRKEIVEPIFGQIKHIRSFRRFSLRGLAEVRSEWRLICTTHNLLKLFRSGYTFNTG